mmetsp:Transcript_116027/g.374790  ORF Transcript_116027/g.374790 Transcript_116027/m.374790 type:complete len:228 (-) Transcript_116027:1095-1778(-)
MLVVQVEDEAQSPEPCRFPLAEQLTLPQFPLLYGPLSQPVAEGILEVAGARVAVVVLESHEPAQPEVPRVAQAFHAAGHGRLHEAAGCPLIDKATELAGELLPPEPTVSPTGLNCRALDGLLCSLILNCQRPPCRDSMASSNGCHEDVAVALAWLPAREAGELLRHRHVVWPGAGDDESVDSTWALGRGRAGGTSAGREVLQQAVHDPGEARSRGYDLEGPHAEPPM